MNHLTEQEEEDYQKMNELRQALIELNDETDAHFGMPSKVRSLDRIIEKAKYYDSLVAKKHLSKKEFY